MMHDLPSGEIVNALTKKYEVCARQAGRYIFYANKFLEEKNEGSLKRKIAWYKTRKQRLLRDMDPAEKKTAAGVMAINKVLDSMAKLEGLMVNNIKIVEPVQIETKVKHEVNYTELPTDVLKAIVGSQPLKLISNG